MTGSGTRGLGPPPGGGGGVLGDPYHMGGGGGGGSNTGTRDHIYIYIDIYIYMYTYVHAGFPFKNGEGGIKFLVVAEHATGVHVLEFCI